VAASVEDLAASVAEMKDAVETSKADEQDAAEVLADTYEGLGAGDIIDIVEAAAGRDIGEVMDALKASDMGEDDDEDDDEMAQSTEKRFEEANAEKGGGATETAAKGVQEDGTSASSGTPSFKQLADEAEETI
jgi:hypothetical protein